ncbi:GtrA family protein [Candidatus Poriferisodalis sp.]|uniref:GtrA family protein n=1 Tax=Candidatus Poriferisodalis sp. TaxID=3101277 RepID=UPI003B51FCEB
MRWGLLLRRLAGYAAVSAGTVVVTQAVLILAYSVLGWPGVVANMVAVCVAAGPAYYANRRWVWARTDPHSVTREIMPFWAYSLAGLGLSSLLVALADRWWQSAVAVSAANLAGFGLLWVGKFVLLDRVLFARSSSDPVPGSPQRP